MELNFIFGDIKSQLNELSEQAKKIDDKKREKEKQKLINDWEDHYSHLNPF